MSAEEKQYLRPVRSKVIVAVLLAVAAIALAVATTYFSFNHLLVKVDELSAPNSKLSALNGLFEEITKLDQQQRADAIRKPAKPHRAFLRESALLMNKIDSLQLMSWDNAEQLDRLEAMKRILERRNHVFIEYLKLRSEYVYNHRFANQLDSLSAVLVNSKPQLDSTVLTTSKKVTTTTYLPEASGKKTSFFSRLFGGKSKADSSDRKVEVKEELTVSVDTLAVAQQDSAIMEVGRIMKKP